MKNRCWLFVIGILTICYVGCRSGGHVMGGDGEHSSRKIHKYVVKPSTTNKNIKKGRDDYYIFAPDLTKAKNKLLIFLPGSLVKPQIYQQILATGAESGYHSVGLSYQNDFTLTGQCKKEGPDCEGNLSREELVGNDYSDKVDISKASSIRGRIVSLLDYLQQAHPDQNWKQFLDGEEIRWADIVIAGHSQGGSHAAYIGWHRRVARVGMFSAPHNVANAEAEAQVSWLEDDRKTPPSKFYGFGNTNDRITPFDLQQGTWSAMKLSGPAISVDTSSAPYRQSHQLSSSTVQKDGLFEGAHGSTAADQTTPKDKQGDPLFKPVWKYLLFPQ